MGKQAELLGVNGIKMGRTGMCGGPVVRRSRGVGSHWRHDGEKKDERGVCDGKRQLWGIFENIV